MLESLCQDCSGESASSPTGSSGKGARRCGPAGWMKIVGGLDCSLGGSRVFSCSALAKIICSSKVGSGWCLTSGESWRMLVTCARRERPIPKALRKVDARHESSGTLNQATFAQHLRRKLAAKALQKLHCRLCVVIYWNVRRSRHGDESLQSCICLLGTILSISTPRTKRFFLVSFHFGIFASRASRANSHWSVTRIHGHHPVPGPHPPPAPSVDPA